MDACATINELTGIDAPKVKSLDAVFSIIVNSDFNFAVGMHRHIIARHWAIVINLPIGIKINMALRLHTNDLATATVSDYKKKKNRGYDPHIMHRANTRSKRLR
jgi:hypothetical protein